MTFLLSFDLILLASKLKRAHWKQKSTAREILLPVKYAKCSALNVIWDDKVFDNL